MVINIQNAISCLCLIIDHVLSLWAKQAYLVAAFYS